MAAALPLGTCVLAVPSAWDALSWGCYVPVTFSSHRVHPIILYQSTLLFPPLSNVVMSVYCLSCLPQ